MKRVRLASLHADASIVLLNTIALLIAVEVGATLGLWALLRLAPRPNETESFYRDPEGWRYVDVTKTLPGDYVPYVIWRLRPYRSPYVRVDDEGFRATPGARCGPDSFKLFMFGGSSMWGTGVPDRATIPAYVQARLDSLHRSPVCTRNFGQPGWVSTQSLIELLRELQAGEEPDLVIFYDGMNDVGMAAAEGVAGGHELMSLIRDKLSHGHASSRAFRQLVVSTRAFVLLERFVPSISGLRCRSCAYEAPVYDPDSLGTAIAEAYLVNVQAVRALSDRFGFDFAFFWQPVMYQDRKVLTAQEAALLDVARAHRSPLAGPVAVSAYRRIRESSQDTDRLFYIADIFEDVVEQAYIDVYSHLTPRGNEIVAQRMVEILFPPGP